MKLDKITVYPVVTGEFTTSLSDADGKNRRDVVQVIDAEALQAMAAAYLADARPILVDADHTAENAGSTEAYAWLRDLSVDGERLAAIFEPTTLGAEAVADYRYRFLSPVFEQKDLQWLDATRTRARPLRLARVSLTNRPNTSVPPLLNAASPRVEPTAPPSSTTQTPTQGNHMDYKAQLIAILGLNAEASDEEIQAGIDALTQKAAEAAAEAAINEAQLPIDDEAKEKAKAAILAAPAAANAIVAGLRAACNAAASHSATKAKAATGASPAQRVLQNSQGRQPSISDFSRARERAEALNAYTAANPAASRDAAYNAVRAQRPDLFN